MQLSLVDILRAAPSNPPPLDIHRIIHHPLPRWITKCHTCQIGVENGCPAEHNSQPCHELPTSAPITRCLPSLPAHCFVPTLVLPSAESLLESDERQPGSLSSATRERLQKCFNNFPDICCNIQQLGVRARALTSLPYPRGGNVCMCWQPCGRFSVGHYFGFMDLRLVFGLDVLAWFFFFFFMRKDSIYFFVEILIMILIKAWMTHQCTLKRQGICFVCYIVQISFQIKRHWPNW